MATKKKVVKKKRPLKKPPAYKPNALVIAGYATPKPAPGHLDYRIVLANVWAESLEKAKLSKTEPPALVLRHRDAFESFGTVQAVQGDYKVPALVLHEGPQPAMIRALGLWETEFYNKYGTLIAHDGEKEVWLAVWKQVASWWLSCEYDHRLLGRLMYDALVALALNAGFAPEDIA